LLVLIVGVVWGLPIGAAVGAVTGTAFGVMIGIALGVSVAAGRIDPNGDNWPAQSRKIALRTVITSVGIVPIALLSRFGPAISLSLTMLMFMPAAFGIIDKTGVPTWGSLWWGEGDSWHLHRLKRAELKLAKKNKARSI
jgi:hypothetical protein